MDVQQWRADKPARRSANETLQTFYKSWLCRFEEDNERFCDRVMQFAKERPPQIARAE